MVSGKGGVGKTTVAAALALALASQGHSTLVVEVEGRQGLAQLFDVPPLPYEEMRIAGAPDGGEVYGLAVEPEAAFYEYLDMFYRLGPAGRVLRKLGAVDFASTIAPGLRDVLLTGKVYEAVGTRRQGRRRYDAVILDAPPTGRITRFLNVGDEVSGLAKVGPVRAQADAITRLIRSPRTAVHLVTLLEDMPVQETSDAVDELRAAEIPVGSIIVNDSQGPDFAPVTIDRLRGDTVPIDEVAVVLKRLGLPKPVASARELTTQARGHVLRHDAQQGLRTMVEGLGHPVVNLPWVPDGIDLAGLYRLAVPLTEHAVAQGWR